MKTKIATLILLVSLTPLLAFTQTLKPDLLNWIHKGINEYTKSIKVETKTISGTKIDGWDATKVKVDNSIDATQYFVGKGDTLGSNGKGRPTNYDFKYEPTMSELFKIYKKLGSSFKPLFNLVPEQASTTFTPVDNRVTMVLRYAADSMTITGVKYSMNAAGAYTADQTNGFALFRLSNDTAYKIAETANTANVWTIAANTPTSIAFTSPVTIAPGFYALGFLYNNSAQTTQPTFAGCQNTLLTQGQSFANGWYISINFNTQNSFAAFYKSSTYYSASPIVPIFYVY